MTKNGRIGTHGNQSDNLWFYNATASAYRMAITTSGNVGIGTTTPDRKLEVDFTNSTYGLKLTRSDATGSSLIELANSAGVKSVMGYDAGN